MFRSNVVGRSIAEAGPFEQSRAASGRGTAIGPLALAIYPGQVRASFPRFADLSQIAGPGDGPALRGGLRP